MDHMTPRDAAKRPQRRDMELCSAQAKRGPSYRPARKSASFICCETKAPASLVSREQKEVSCSLAPAAAAREILCDGSTA